MPPKPKKDAADTFGEMTSNSKNESAAQVETETAVESRENATGYTVAGPSTSTTTQYYTPAQFLSSGYHAPHTAHAPTSGGYSVPLADSDYATFMAQHGGQVAPHVVYEAKRATRQMAHYFDVSQYKTQLDQGTAPVPPDPSTLPKRRPTKKELEQFRKRKEERKRIRNRWLFE
ncbi:hypothetical protein PSACC_02896 [Paramicrosporidium saccamoebae]|uniref:Uncharacterized protein n=1 Tax=Paramicrosporidium saccamoebae TaxID=1246581 RepID=A0A2H9THP7_9FUNG|nr:hypothetical protein PSACC_02896 [Paramicrosporidium saccamoebae]